MFLAMKEKQFVKHIVNRLLESYQVVSDKQPGLSGGRFYREVLLHSGLVDESIVDEVLWQAEDSADEWTALSPKKQEFRQIVYFVVMKQYLKDNTGTVVSMRDSVYSLVGEDL
jgi:hypothetical protein